MTTTSGRVLLGRGGAVHHDRREAVPRLPPLLAAPTADVFRTDGSAGVRRRRSAGSIWPPSQQAARPRRAAPSVLEAADALPRHHPDQAYGVPDAPRTLRLGLQQQILNNLVVLATAFDLTGDAKYRDGVLEASTTSSAATRSTSPTSPATAAALTQPAQPLVRPPARPGLPNPPAGTLAGGPNSSLQDPYARACSGLQAPQFCYIDDIESWSTNELDHQLELRAGLGRVVRRGPTPADNHDGPYRIGDVTVSLARPSGQRRGAGRLVPARRVGTGGAMNTPPVRHRCGGDSDERKSATTGNLREPGR